MQAASSLVNIDFAHGAAVLGLVCCLRLFALIYNILMLSGSVPGESLSALFTEIAVFKVYRLIASGAPVTFHSGRVCFYHHGNSVLNTFAKYPDFKYR